MARLLIFALSLALLISCTDSKPFPKKTATGINISSKSTVKSSSNDRLQNLLTFVNMFENRENSFDIKVFEEQWDDVLPNMKYVVNNVNDMEIWVRTTGLLLELTQKEKFAAELEYIGSCSAEAFELVKPYVLTKNTDFLYLNLFEPAEINYTHTLGGEVRFKQESQYPESGSIKLHFGMTERRYMELYIRIPMWAEGSTVTVKQVKYFAAPGSYCKIAKKWKDGDLVEIEFPIHQRPQYEYMGSAPISYESETLALR